MKPTGDTRLHLKAQKREILGKKVKKLRSGGQLPANVYGEGLTSNALTIDTIEFSKLYRKAGETGVIYVGLDKEELPVLIHRIQRHPVGGHILHVDFRNVNLKKKIEAQVPVHIIGESEAVAKKGGVLLHLEETLSVEALPDRLPSNIEIDISTLSEIGAEIKVADLKKSADFEFKDEPEKLIVRITEHKEEEVTPQVEAVPVEVEGEAPAEGEEPAEGVEGGNSEQTEDKAPDQPAKSE